MTQQPANLRANILSHGYRLRFAIAVVCGFVCSTLAALALPGDTGSSRVLAPVVLPFAIPFCLLFLATLFLLGEVGHWTPRRVGAIRSGVVAAAVVGACFGLSSAVVSVGVSAFTSGLASGSYLGIALLVLVIHMLYDAVTFGISGAIVGGIGAAIGRSQYRRQRSEQLRMMSGANEVSPIHDRNQAQPISGPGYYEGRHFTTYVGDVKALKWGGDNEAVERLLLALVDATEAESRANGPRWGVAPWCYAELARLYRQRMDYAAEVAILNASSAIPMPPE